MRVISALFMVAAALLAAVSGHGPVRADDTAPTLGLHSNTPNVVAFTNTRIVAAPGRVIENAALVIRDRRIEAVGAGIAVPPDAVVRDCAGKTIYPGFIDPCTRYGVPDIPPALSGPRHWNDAVRPETSAALLFRPDGKNAVELRKNGFCAAAVFYGKGLFRGEGALVLTGDYDPGETVLEDDIGQSISLAPAGNDYPQSLMGRVALIRQTLLDALWYEKAREAYRASPEGQKTPEINLSLAALVPCAQGKHPAMMEAASLPDIFLAASIAREFGLDFRIAGCGEEYRRIDSLKEAGVKLIIPLNFPDPPDASSEDVSLIALRHWDFEPENPARLARSTYHPLPGNTHGSGTVHPRLLSGG